MMKKIITCILFAFLIICAGDGSNRFAYEVHVLDASISGGEYFFSLYLKSTGLQPLYLADSQIALVSDDTALTCYRISTIVTGEKLRQTYSVLPVVDDLGQIIINIAAPPFGDQEEFEIRILSLERTDPGTFIGRYRISSDQPFPQNVSLYSFFSGTRGTDIYRYRPEAPWMVEQVMPAENVDY